MDIWLRAGGPVKDRQTSLVQVLRVKKRNQSKAKAGWLKDISSSNKKAETVTWGARSVDLDVRSLPSYCFCWQLPADGADVFFLALAAPCPGLPADQALQDIAVALALACSGSCPKCKTSLDGRSNEPCLDEKRMYSGTGHLPALQQPSAYQYKLTQAELAPPAHLPTSKLGTQSAQWSNAAPPLITHHSSPQLANVHVHKSCISTD